MLTRCDAMGFPFIAEGLLMAHLPDERGDR
jgi:hypothetical protein